MLAVTLPLAVARLKPPAAPSVMVSPLMMPLVSRPDDDTLMMIWLVAPPNVCPLPATRLAVAPAERPTALAVSRIDEPPPLPAVLWIVEFPALNRTLPTVAALATPLPPSTLSVPPLNTIVAVALSRLGLLTAVLS